MPELQLMRMVSLRISFVWRLFLHDSGADWRRMKETQNNKNNKSFSSKKGLCFQYSTRHESCKLSRKEVPESLERSAWRSVWRFPQESICRIFPWYQWTENIPYVIMSESGSAVTVHGWRRADSDCRLCLCYHGKKWLWYLHKRKNSCSRQAWRELIDACLHRSKGGSGIR